MTDNEIIQVLKDCSESCGDKCKLCPIFHECVQNDCFLDKQALDLINRKKSEIERLQKEIQIAKDAYTMLQTKTEIIKIKAIKEFAARLKCGVPQDTGVIRCIDVDSLIKEMVCEDND